MGIGTYLILTIISCGSGIWINYSFREKYQRFATAWVPFVFQTIFLFLAWYNKPDSTRPYQPKSSYWFFIWLALTVLAYLIGIVVCWRQAGRLGASNPDKFLAVLSQMLLPIGVLLFIIGFIVLLAASKDPNKTQKNNSNKTELRKRPAPKVIGEEDLYRNGNWTIRQGMGTLHQTLRNGFTSVAYYDTFENKTYTSGGKFIANGDILREIAEGRIKIY